MNCELDELKREWKTLHGASIPPHIQILPTEEIRKAIKFYKERKYQPVSETSGNDDSLLDSDNHNNLT